MDTERILQDCGQILVPEFPPVHAAIRSSRDEFASSQGMPNLRSHPDGDDLPDEGRFGMSGGVMIVDGLIIEVTGFTGECVQVCPTIRSLGA